MICPSKLRQSMRPNEVARIMFCMRVAQVPMCQCTMFDDVHVGLFGVRCSIDGAQLFHVIIQVAIIINAFSLGCANNISFVCSVGTNMSLHVVFGDTSIANEM